jgi:serine/threonine protein kinase
VADLSDQQFGNYRLLQVLGQGGQASVYLGQHLRLQQKLAAIKILHAKVSQQDIEAFQQEANTIAALQHPHIVNVLDFDIQQGTPFLVMEYYPDSSLRERHPRGEHVPLATVISYVKQVAEALQHAHDHRLIHRDVKAANMLIGRSGEIILSDFGIVAIAHSTSSIGIQNFAGTAPYMAPEQIKQHPRRESDQYALAVVAYEWLCGEPPFIGTPEEIAIKHLTVEPSSLCQKLPGFSPHVDQVILKALMKDPKARFATVQAFAIALEQARQDTEMTVAPLSISSLSLPNQHLGSGQESAWIAGETLHLKKRVSEDFLTKGYTEVWRGNITDPEAIREIAAHFQALANDPIESQSVSFDAAHAAQNLYEQARRCELEESADKKQRVAMQPLWQRQRVSNEKRQAIIDRPPQQSQRQKAAAINQESDQQQRGFGFILLSLSLLLFGSLTVFSAIPILSELNRFIITFFGWSAYLLAIGLAAIAVVCLTEDPRFLRGSRGINLLCIWLLLLIESRLLAGHLAVGVLAELLVTPLLGWPPVVQHGLTLGLLLFAIVETFRSILRQI